MIFIYYIYNVINDDIMKASDLNKLDSNTNDVVMNLMGIGFKLNQISIYTMYANVHISLPSAMKTSAMKKIVKFLPDDSSISAGNNFRSGLTIRLPWNFPAENYQKKHTHFD